MLQTRRHAEYVADVATLAKLCGGFLQLCEDDLVHSVHEHEFLEHLSDFLIDEFPVRFTPLMRHKVVANEYVDQDNLSRNAKRIRKRPREA